MDDENIVIDKYVLDKGKLKHESRTETKNLRKWFDDEIGYDVLDGFI